MPSKTDITKNLVSGSGQRQLRASAAISILFLAALFLLLVVHLKKSYSGSASFFDDSYMFYRYAVHVRQGLGWSWNLDGVHTYGQTSLGWGFVVLLLSLLPMGIAKTLVFGSWLTSIAALCAMAHAISSNARSAYFSSMWRVLVLIGWPLAVCAIFLFQEVTGMDTMLGLLVVSAYVGMVLAWSRGTVRPEWVGVVGGLALVTRPESAVIVVLMPVLAYLLLREKATRESLVRLLGTFALLAVVYFVGAKLYFHTMLPLSFYMKSRHAYEGYAGRWLPASSAVAFFGSSCIFLLVIACCMRKKDLRLLAVCFVPLLVTVVALCRVTQIMGQNSRYYVPYFALIIVPAMLLLDGRVAEREDDAEHAGEFSLIARYAMVFVVLCLLQPKFPGALFWRVDQAFEGKKVVYAESERTIDATRPLPYVDPMDSLRDVADLLVEPLPKGSTVAASEVGYVGAMAPQVNVIDMAGLNDTEIALHGFDAEAFLARKPDLIWMPHLDYTYQRGVLFTTPSLLREYTVIDGAGTYGIAIRKDSPNRAQIDNAMQAMWKKRYDGYAMSDYVVRSVHWDRSTHVLAGNSSSN